MTREEIIQQIAIRGNCSLAEAEKALDASQSPELEERLAAAARILDRCSEVIDRVAAKTHELGAKYGFDITGASDDSNG